MEGHGHVALLMHFGVIFHLRKTKQSKLWINPQNQEMLDSFVTKNEIA